jgi:DNA polymerase-1
LAARELVLFNAAFDLAFLWQLGFRPGKVCDLMLLSRLLTAGTTAENTLAAVALRELGMELLKDFQKANWSGEVSSEMLAYAACDVQTTLDLYRPLCNRIREAGLETIADIENRAVPAVVWMGCSGMPWCPVAWEGLAAVAREEEAELKEQLHVLARPRPNGRRWNWKSPKQVKEALSLAGIDLSSTQDAELSGIDHPLAVLLRKHRHASHRVKAFGKHWLGFDDGGRIYATWNQLGADSGRTSCTQPNLQQVPREADYRRCFVAPPGRALVKADYGQLQLRIAAKVANDPAMLDAFARGEDLHTRTAQHLTGKAEVSRDDRQLAKSLNFGLLFGMGSKSLASYARQEYGITLTEEKAQTLRSKFFASYPGLQRWHEGAARAQHLARAGVRSAGESRTILGRRRLFDIDTPLTFRLASPVQGAEADGAKLALALLWERRGDCPSAFPVAFIHDEIVVEADESRADVTAEWLRQGMIHGIAEILNPVPVVVDTSIRKTWAGNDVPVLPAAGANGVVTAATPPPPLIDKVVYWITERESIRLKREAGEPPPWSADAILSQYRWTNCRRMDDRVSRWLLDNWYFPNRGHPNMVPAVVLARHLNLPASLEVTGFPRIWDPDEMKKRLHTYRQAGHIVFGAAYVIAAGGKGENKIDHVIDIVVQPFFDNPPVIDPTSMEKTWEVITRYPGMGSFMAGQVVADLRWAIEGTWADKETWAPMGPGSKRGINRVFGRDPNESLDQEQFLDELRALAAGCKQRLPESITGRLEMADWQNIACETDKFLRTLAGEGKPKRKYRGSGTVPPRVATVNGTASVAAVSGAEPVATVPTVPRLPSGVSRPIKRHGGKSYLAKKIIALMPPRAQNPNAPAKDDPGWVHFVEPYAGGLAVLLALDPEGISEVVNDLDAELTNFWVVLRSPTDFPELVRLAQMTPVSQVEFERAGQDTSDLSPPERALAFLVRNRQSRQALGRDFCTPVRNRTRRRMQEQVSSWLSGIEGLSELHARLQRVAIFSCDALSLIRREDGPRTLFYLDPPYLHQTRTATDAYGAFELSTEQHRALLEVLATIEGRFLLSGYHSPLYDDYAQRHGWQCTEFALDNKAGSGAAKRRMTECVWTNYQPREGV